MHAIILAGGMGERLRPLTNDRPKGMVEVNGQPLLAYQVAWLRRQGITEIVISCGYLAGVIEQFFGAGEAFGVPIRYVREEQPLGRGGAFRRALETIASDEPIVGTNGDLVTNLGLAPVIERHRAAGVLATDVLVPLRSPYGVVEIDGGGLVTGFREKPELPYWINAGIYIFDPAIRDLLPERGDHEDTTFPRLAAERRLLGYPTRAYWRTADTAKDIGELNRDLHGRDLESFLAAEDAAAR